MTLMHLLRGPSGRRPSDWQWVHPNPISRLHGRCCHFSFHTCALRTPVCGLAVWVCTAVLISRSSFRGSASILWRFDQTSCTVLGSVLTLLTLSATCKDMIINPVKEGVWVWSLLPKLCVVEIVWEVVQEAEIACVLSGDKAMPAVAPCVACACALHARNNS